MQIFLFVQNSLLPVVGRFVPVGSIPITENIYLPAYHVYHSSLSFGRKIESQPREKRDWRTCDLPYLHHTCLLLLFLMPYLSHLLFPRNRSIRFWSDYLGTGVLTRKWYWELNIWPCHNCTDWYLYWLSSKWIRCDSPCHVIWYIGDGKFRVYLGATTNHIYM